MKTKLLFLTSAEAIAAKDGLTAIVRVMKKQPPAGYKCCHDYRTTLGYPASEGKYWVGFYGNPEDPIYYESPLGKPGDILAGKETGMPETEGGIPTGGYIYKATNSPEPDGDISLKWRSPILMPSWAVRHWFKVKSVRAMQNKEIPLDSLIKGEVIMPQNNSINTWLWYTELERSEKP